MKDTHTLQKVFFSSFTLSRPLQITLYKRHTVKPAILHRETSRIRLQISIFFTNIARLFLYYYMKKLLGLLCLVLGLFGSCTPRPYPSLLQTADSLASACPDSARSLLASLAEQMNEAPEATRMYYYLLCIKADDKAYISHTSDSLIQVVLHYYEKNNDRQHLPEAYYYTGRVYRDLGDAPQALDYFQQAAISIKEQKSTDSRLKSMIYYQTGLIHLYQGIYDKALEAFKQSKENTEWAKDSIFLVFNLREIGRAYSALHQADSTLYYYEAAKQLTIQLHNNTLTSIVNQEISDIYLQLGYIDKAKSSLMSSLGTLKNYPAPYYSTLAYYYSKIGKNDSATYYYKQMLYTGNHYHKRTAYKGLSEIARKQGNPSLALGYMDKSIIYADSIQQHINKEAVHKVNALYNYQLREKENQHLKEIRNSQKTLIIILFFSFTLIFVLFIAAYIIYRINQKRKQQKIENLQERLKQIADQQYQNSLEFVFENEKRIKELRKKLLDSNNRKDELIIQLQTTEKTLLELTNRQVEIRREINKLSVQALSESQIYKDFHHFACSSKDFNYSNKEKLTSNEWLELATKVDETYNGFTKRLLNFYPNISKHEMRISILIKIGIPPMGMAQITNRSKQAITSVRKSLFQKTHNQEGKAEDWDNFIRQF